MKTYYNLLLVFGVILILNACDFSDPEPKINETLYPDPLNEIALAENKLTAAFETEAENKVLKLNFVGFNFEDESNIQREGLVQIELVSGNALTDQGAIFDVVFTDYKITDLLEDKFVILNGTRRFINETGGNVVGPTQNPNAAVVFSKVRSFGFEIKYSGSNKVIVFNTARRKRFEKIPQSTYIEYNTIVQQDTTLNGWQVKDWGTMRNGDAFFNIVIQPIKRVFCGDRAVIVSGELERRVGDNIKRVVYGVDENGNLDSNCSTTFGMKVTPVDNSGTPIGPSEIKEYAW